MMETGRGGFQNPVMAFPWYLKSAEQGYDVGQSNVGAAYYEANGVRRDYVAARGGESPGVALKLYPGATHAFDARGPERYAYGHRLVYHETAAEDSFAMTQQFLDARLK